jgi:hypothetical protein
MRRYVGVMLLVTINDLQFIHLSDICLEHKIFLHGQISAILRLFHFKIINLEVCLLFCGAVLSLCAGRSVWGSRSGNGCQETIP